MESLVATFISMLGKGEYLSLLIGITVSIFLNYRKILESFDQIQKRRLERIKEALSSDYTSGLTRERLKEDLETEYYRLATGVFAEKPLREEMINTHKSMEKEVGFYHFLRARDYISLENGMFSIKIKRIDNAAYYYNIFTSLLLFLGAAFILLTIVFSPGGEWGGALRNVLYLTFVVLALIFTLTQIKPTFSARLIQRTLRNLKVDTENV